MTDHIKQIREDFMSLVDSHGAERWNTGCAETNYNKLEAKRFDKHAVEARGEIAAAMTALLARLDAAEAKARQLDLLAASGHVSLRRLEVAGKLAAMAQGVKP